MRAPSDYKPVCRGMVPGDAYQITVNGVPIYVLIKAKGRGESASKPKRILFLAPPEVIIQRVALESDEPGADPGTGDGDRPLPDTPTPSVAIIRARLSPRRGSA